MLQQGTMKILIAQMLRDCESFFKTVVLVTALQMFTAVCRLGEVLLIVT